MSNQHSHTQSLESYYQKFRKNIIGIDQEFTTPYGKQKLTYFDWTASGRLYGPIEEAMSHIFGPYVGNTHTETTETGTDMTLAYHKAYEIIKRHVHADASDVLIPTGTGTTGAINKLQRILGLKYSDQLSRYTQLVQSKQTHSLSQDNRPIVFITHMEHHSNQTSWEEADVDVVMVPPTKEGAVSPDNLENLLKKYRERKIKIGSFTACSNVTGILTPIHTLAKIMHEYGGYCFADFAAAAPYIAITMHTKNPSEKLDAVFFSPHKFLGGPGTPGILIFDKKLYPQGNPPDHPGGGTVLWTNPWKGRKYHASIEAREDGGTPGFLQMIRAALCVQLKEQMGVHTILAREEQLLRIIRNGLKEIPDIFMLSDNQHHRLGIVAFYSKQMHYNLIVKLLNDRFGIQTRGGCSCAGTYGHCLFNISEEQSKIITDKIDQGDQSTKPGWVRVSLHPTIQDSEAHLLINALKSIIAHRKEWEKDYVYDKSMNEFKHKHESDTDKKEKIATWFTRTLEK